MKKTVNHIQIVGLARSGNHAIINWIINHCPGSAFHINNSPLEPQFIFRGLHDTHLNNTSPYVHLLAGITRVRSGGQIRRFFGERIYNLCVRVRHQAFRRCQYENLIISYEDRELDKLFDSYLVGKREEVLGRTDQKYDLLILRDPYNMMASRIQSGFTRHKFKRNDPYKNAINASGTSTISLWKQYANEYLGTTQYLKNIKVVINYNRWFVDRDYRASILRQLGFEGRCKGIYKVTDHGGGSSFDGIDYDGRAEKMDVLNRYKKFKDNAEYRRIFEDVELVDLSTKIFGKIDLE